MTKIIFVLLLFSTVALAKKPCEPFRVHNSASLPPAPADLQSSFEKGEEALLLSSISKVKTQEIFETLYKNWMRQNTHNMSEQDRVQWLRCLNYYVHLDTNKNGIPDWSALSDNQPARVLFPQDIDMDGDGTPNTLDPNPLDPKIKGALSKTKIPTHLLLKGKARVWQEKIFTQFEILAIDHTDHHSPVVLKEFYDLLKDGFQKEELAKIRSIHHLYAFAGHDANYHIASYHREAKAISIGGLNAYPDDELPSDERILLISALAHEMGHALLFDQVSPKELIEVAKQHGHWESQMLPNDGLYSEQFFKPHPLQMLAEKIPSKLELRQKFLSLMELKNSNLTSQYSTRNIHEWFAEAFSSHLMLKLGEKNFLGANWKALISRIPQKNLYWFNHSNLSQALSDWFHKKLNVNVPGSFPE